VLQLEKVPGDSDVDYHYRRISLLRDIGDSHSFKLRYKPAPDAGIPEAGCSRDMWEEDPTSYTRQPQPGLVLRGRDGTVEYRDHYSSNDGNEPGDLGFTRRICLLGPLAHYPNRSRHERESRGGSDPRL
jgi:hypothetical protein